MKRLNRETDLAGEDTRKTAFAAGGRARGVLPWRRAFAAVCALTAFLAPAFAEPAPKPAAEGPAAGSGADGKGDSATAPLPETPEGLHRYAQQMESEGKMMAACDAYERFMEKFPEHSQIQEMGYRLGKCLDAVGRVDEAVQRLEAATRVRNARFKNRQDALFLLGKLHGDMGEYEKACKAFETLLGEGAGLYEEETLNLCGGYYALQKKYNEAAGRLNMLKRKEGSRFAERAAYKLVLIWLDAGNLDLAVEAVSDLAKQFPRNQDARGLMLRIADVFRQQRKFSQAIAICDQLKSVFPKSAEASASGYVVGLCYRDQKLPDKAVEALIATARIPENVKTGVGAEAMVKAADITFAEKADSERAMDLYEEAVGLARDYTDEERRQQVLEMCYFRLAEHNFLKQKWSVALEFYALLQKNGTKINVLPRIMKCQAELGMDPNAYARGDREIEFIRTKIRENPGTFAAAEGEIFLADQELNRALDRKDSMDWLRRCAETYTDVLKRYPAEILAESHLRSYIFVQLGRCHSAAYSLARERGIEGGKSYEAAIEALERALRIDAESPYAREALESIAQTADTAGDKEKAYEAYKRLYELTGEKLKTAGSDKALQEDRMGYLRSMLTRAEATETIEDAIGLSRRIIEQEGVASPAARHALFYTGELYYMRKDFSSAAKAFRQFIATYGPEQNAVGDFAAGPMKVAAVDETTRQLFDAALRTAHAWYLQGHHQNTIKAYAWMARNLPNGNRYVAEANYWLAMETVQGKEGELRENRRKLADLLWTNVVSTVALREFPMPAGTAAEERLYHPWVRDRDMMKYPSLAMVKVGQILGEQNEHETAARVFTAYLILYPPPPPPRRGEPPVKDELGSIARYALGQEYIAMKDYEKMIAVYKPYLDGMRDDPMRVSALRFVGFHASTGSLKPRGIEAYATLLDEYGTNPRDMNDRIVPIEPAQRIRQSSSSWNGIRMPPPKDFDFGQVRYALGFLYWNNEDWEKCVRTLAAFVDDPSLLQCASRAKALYMLGKSYFKLGDPRNGSNALVTLIGAHPKFEAIEEVFTQAALGAMMAGDWPQILQLHDEFMRRFKVSLYQPRMEYYWAVALLNIPDRRREGYNRMVSLSRSETYQDVRADALYYQGVYLLSVALKDVDGKVSKGDYRMALSVLADSVEMFPRAAACLEAAKCAAALGEWASAKEYLDRLLRDFPDSGAATLEPAKALLTQARKEIVKSKTAGGQ